MHHSRLGFFGRAVACGIAFTLGLALPAQQPAHVVAQKPVTAAIEMTPVRPEQVGFSSERLERLHKVMQETVDRKQLAGIVTILARHGKIVDYRAYGQRDMASGAPMTKDTIFRDYSMTKPVTAVAMMISTSRASGCRRTLSRSTFRSLLT